MNNLLLPSIPYPGLCSFSREDSAIFFGRDKQIEQLLKRLAKSRNHFLAIVGSSGSGKSSLVRAGLIPSLQRGWYPQAGLYWGVAEFRPSSNPFYSLAKALLAPNVYTETPVETQGEQFLEDTNKVKNAIAFLAEKFNNLDWTIKDFFENNAPDNPNTNLLIVIDQFEELFRYQQDIEECIVNPAEQLDKISPKIQKFISLLLDACQHPHIYIVMTMRMDFLPECGRYRGLTEYINDGLFLTLNLTESEMQEAIMRPAEAYDGFVEEELVEALLHDMQYKSTQLPAMQQVLLQMWLEQEELVRQKKLIGENITIRLTLENYKKIGGLTGVIDKCAEDIYLNLNDEEQHNIVETLFRALTESGEGRPNIRRSINFNDIILLTNKPRETIQSVVNAFRQPEKRFLLPTIEKCQYLKDNDVIDITHESLIEYWQRLKKWMHDEARSAEIYHHLATTAKLWHQGKEELWTGVQLDVTEQWVNDKNPTSKWAERYLIQTENHFDLALTFLKKSSKAKRHRRMVKISLFMGFLAFAVFMGGFMYYTLSLENTKLKEVEISLHKNITGLNKSHFSNALLLSNSGYYSNTKTALAELQTKLEPKYQENANWLKQYTHIVSEDALETLPKDQKFLPPLRTIAINPAKDILIAGGEKSTLIGFDMRQNYKEIFRKQDHSKNTDVVRIVFDPDGQWFASLAIFKAESGKNDSSEILLYRKIGEHWQKEKYWTTTNQVASLAAFQRSDSIISNKDYLVAAGNKGGLYVWSIQHKDREELFSLEKNKEKNFTSVFFIDDKLMTVSQKNYSSKVERWQINYALDQKDISLSSLSVPLFPEIKFAIPSNTPFDPALIAAVGQSGNTIYLGSPKDYSNLLELNGHDSVYALAFTHDNRYLISAGRDKIIRTWDVNSRQLLKVQEGHTAAVTSLAVVDNETVYSVANDGKIKLWNANLSNSLQIIPTFSVFHDITLHPKTDLVATSNGREVYFYDFYGFKENKKFRISSPHIGRTLLVFSPTGTWLATSGYEEPNPTLILWTVTSDGISKHRDFSLPKNATYIEFSPNGKSLAVALDNGEVGLLDLMNIDTSSLRYFTAHDYKIFSIAFNVEGNLLVSGGEDRSQMVIKIWELQEGTQTARQEIPLQGEITDIEFNPEREKNEFVAVSRSQEILLFEQNNENIFKLKPESSSLKGHQNIILQALYSPTGNQLLTLSSDSTIRMWDLLDYQQLFSLQLPIEPNLNSDFDRPSFDFNCGENGKGECRIVAALPNQRIVTYNFGKIYNNEQIDTKEGK